ncbi:hypothetical protein [Ruegeria arenilitoris]|uniref:hypothetical protein n=1 Tax=Ruegeria arenilitoris TaxID=1173585 RepID=UPI00147AC2C8|nr:hypothetical protein [Ruegeria arenilitoris]
MVGKALRTGRSSTFVVWGLLAFFVMSNMLIGGVVLDHRELGAGYELLIRDPQEHWVSVSIWQFWLYFLARYALFIVVLFGLSFWILAWVKREMFDQKEIKRQGE